MYNYYVDGKKEQFSTLLKRKENIEGRDEILEMSKYVEE
jgi:hypothetical protein